DEGVLARILVAEGAEGVPVNSVIAVLLEEGEDLADFDVSTPPPPQAQAPEIKPEPTQKPKTPTFSNGQRIFISPLARRMAEQGGLDLKAVRGTGPKGRIVKRDIKASPKTSHGASPEAAYTEVPHTTMRKVIAQRLSEAKRDIPHYYLSVDCKIDCLLETRKKLNAKASEGKGAYKISVNDFVVRAVALALKQYPAVNASWSDEAVRHYNDIDISVAVAAPGGLVTPVVRQADAKGLGALSREIKALAERAREGKLAPEEYQGGGFTISNLGMYGVKEFAAIINPPQSCILAVGAGEQRPVAENGELSVATVMTCTLSVDHRTVDGALAAQFLSVFKGFMEEPLTMLL
ncbi:MAG TPA: pyruvate dehydrogenase complex dihydrolipoamide acetyltransferase, partial [Rhodospirillales bacterium]|nr:pyruvate dehydrogenase complex dihydrolipoamide acetyltransferase [Rhodospirillales bacterium]